MNDVLARADGVSRTFGRGSAAVVAVHDVDCEVRAGARIAIVGPSGSGKSTLLHLLAGLELPTRGTVSWPALGPRESLQPSSVSFVPQGLSLVPFLDVMENVMLPLLLAGGAPDEARATAGQGLLALGLDAVATQLPEELSGGQTQRAAVVRALVPAPRLLLADEPTGQLDRTTASKVLDHLLGGVAEDGAVVVSSHDDELAVRFDVVWQMRDGRLGRLG